MWNLVDDECIEQLIDQLKKILEFDVLNSKLKHWTYAQPRNLLKHYFRVADKQKNLIVCGEIFGGAKVEGAFLSGLRTAENLVSQKRMESP